jgi:enoyl-CoA hydratase/carnithine racemase
VESALICGELEFMNYENILFEKKGAIAYVTVNRPKVLNALNMATMEELRGRFTTLRTTKRFAS